MVMVSLCKNLLFPVIKPPFACLASKMPGVHLAYHCRPGPEPLSINLMENSADL
jgi:hypothetical protein